MLNIILKTAAGRFGTLTGGCVVAAAVWMGLGGSLGAAPPPVDPPTCLPTCAESDGRMLVVAGNDDTTLAAVEITLGLSFTVANSPVGNFRLFDGDADLTNWDTRYFGTGGATALPPQLIIELVIDPAGNGGVGNLPIHSWTPGAGAPVALPALGEHGAFPTTNNAFNGVEFPHDASALSGANYKYAVRIRPQIPETNKGWNAFKMGADGKVLLLGNQVVGFTAALNNLADINTIYPNFDFGDGQFGRSAASLAGTLYNGAWTFQTTLPAFLGDVTIFDGDMDYGDNACAFNDTDDPDTPPGPAGIPPFASPATTFEEGVAQAVSPEPTAKFCNNSDGALRTGLPADDNGDPLWERDPLTTVPNGIAYKLVSPPSVKYPTGQIFINANPSGNREWEQFKIQLVADADFPDASDPCPLNGFAASGPYPASDCRTDVLPGGDWIIELEGMDMQNLNFWFFSFKVEPPPTDYSIGRLVWLDSNSNGVQDGVEPGIPNVAYTVLDGPGGTPVRTGFTDGNGEFFEGEPGDPLGPLSAGNYTVVVDAGNFGPGGPLAGLTSTTGGETQNGIEVGLDACTDTNVPAGCGQPLYAEALFGYVDLPDPPFFIVIDEDSIDNGVQPNNFSAMEVNEQLATVGLRAILPRFNGAYIGQELTLFTGETTDHGWFSVPTILESWADAGPTTDGLKNFVGVGNAVGPGLGSEPNAEALLDKIPDVTPWNAAMLYASVGSTFCAVVYDGSISINQNPLTGSLKGANLGIVAFQVLEVTDNTAGQSTTTLPKVRLVIRDAAQVCAGVLNNQPIGG